MKVDKSCQGGVEKYDDLLKYECLVQNTNALIHICMYQISV